MRLLIVSPKLYGGGAENCAVLWANGFADNGHDILMLSDIYSRIVYQCSDSVCLDALFPEKSSFKVSKWYKAILNIRKAINEWEPDAIIGVMAACSFASKIASIGSNIPVIMTEHSAFERPDNAKFTRKELFFKFYLNKIYDVVTVITQRDKEVIGKRLKKVVVMPNPLSLIPVDIRPLKSNYVLAAGRLDAWFVKGFDVLLEAWQQVSKKHPNWKLKIAGAGKADSVSFIMKKLSDLGIESSVEILGLVKDMESVYKAADVFVLSSRYEGFGLVLIEAMSQGCACIACDYLGRQKEILGDSRNGVLCQPDNVNELADSLNKLLTNDSMRKELGDNAIVRSSLYYNEVIIQKWQEMLNGLLSH